MKNFHVTLSNISLNSVRKAHVFPRYTVYLYNFVSREQKYLLSVIPKNQIMLCSLSYYVGNNFSLLLLYTRDSLITSYYLSPKAQALLPQGLIIFLRQKAFSLTLQWWESNCFASSRHRIRFYSSGFFFILTY